MRAENELEGEPVRDSALFSTRVVTIAIAVYIVLVVVASFYFRISLTPDRLAVLLVIAALGTGKVRAFLRDWSIFIIVFLAWQVLQGMSQSFNHARPHVSEMITVDRFLFFGHVPTVWLQQHLYHPGHIAWYDIAASVFYGLHFVFPLACAFAFWFACRRIFLEFMASLLFLALAGFATYLLFPAAPPWIAADWYGLLPHVTQIFNQAMIALGGQQSYSTIYQWAWSHGGYDYYGAMPSEHAAFPFLCFLYAVKTWRRAGWLLLPYCFAVWLSVVYLGEHYVTDVIAGVVYAGLAFAAVQLAMARRAARAEKSSEVAAARAVSGGIPA